MGKKVFLGIDVGSVTTKCALMDDNMQLIAHRYIPTSGKPIIQIQSLMREISSEIPTGCEIGGAGTTGSARYLAGEIVAADVIKNEITAHAVAATISTRMSGPFWKSAGRTARLLLSATAW